MMHWTRVLLAFLLCLLQGVNSEITMTTVSATAVSGAVPTIPAVLECRIYDEYSDIDPEADVYYSWLSPDNTILTFNENILVNGRLTPGMQMVNEVRLLTLTIDPVLLSDQGIYTCQFTVSSRIIKSPPGVPLLMVNQLPEVGVKREKTQVVEGSLIRLATCYANLSKPAPQIWFEDSSGNIIDSESVIENKQCGNGLTNSTLYLANRFTRQDNSETYFCRVLHVNMTEPLKLVVGGINVMYPPEASFVEKSLTVASPRVMEEDGAFSAVCDVQGNPSPDITWSFYPDVSPSANSTQPATPAQAQGLPANFVVTEDGRTVVTPAVQLGNNGTYECRASNDIGSDAVVSFKLAVYEKPTTPAPTTTEALTSEESKDYLAPTAAPNQAGPDAALIAGVVAVAVFILILTVILLLRYFMSHKGEYYTHEFNKPISDARGEEISDDSDDELPRTEADLLGGKKRSEHFL